MSSRLAFGEKLNKNGHGRLILPTAKTFAASLSLVSGCEQWVFVATPPSLERGWERVTCLEAESPHPHWDPEEGVVQTPSSRPPASVHVEMLTCRPFVGTRHLLFPISQPP